MGGRTGKDNGKAQSAGNWVFVPEGVNPKAFAKGCGKAARGNKGRGKAAQGSESQKHALQTAVQLLMGRSSTKEDIVYSFSEEDGKHIAVVSLPAIDAEEKEFTGRAKATEKDAAQSATQEALQKLKKEIKEASATRNAAKEEKHKERIAVMKAKRQENVADKKEKREEKTAAKSMVAVKEEAEDKTAA